MNLSKVAQYFNRTKFQDAYSGLELGVGQLDVFDDSTRDGSTVQRRVFEVAPGTVMPPRLAIQFHGRQWLVGVTEIDAFNGGILREKHVLHQAEGLASVYTLKQILNDVDPLEAYASRVWVKAGSEVEVSSEKFNQLQIFFTRSESIVANQIISLGGRLHTVMETYPAAAGHMVAISEELEATQVETAQVTTQGNWNRVTETYDTATIDTPLLRLRWQSDFQYHSQATPDFERGDLQAVTLSSFPNGTQITLADGSWMVVASQARNEVYYLHLRRG